jgi:hypothetical protein
LDEGKIHFDGDDVVINGIKCNRTNMIKIAINDCYSEYIDQLLEGYEFKLDSEGNTIYQHALIQQNIQVFDRLYGIYGEQLNSRGENVIEAYVKSENISKVVIEHLRSTV